MSKKRLTLSVEETLIKKIKHIAIEEETNISALFEEYIPCSFNSSTPGFCYLHSKRKLR